MILDKIFAKPIDFFELLNKQADYIPNAACELKKYVETLTPEAAENVRAIEKEADRCRMNLVHALNSTFITPFDREDIFLLSSTLDDILDYFKTTVSEMKIYQIVSSSDLPGFASLLEEGSRAICVAVHEMKKNPETATRSALKAKKSENRVEKLYCSSVATLLESNDIKRIIKMRELYRHLSNCADRIDKAGDAVCIVLMKTSS
jgi:predicted phosphate transport protein (TIGR00153 family)